MCIVCDLIFFRSFSVDEDSNLIPPGMTNDGIAQSWIRFLKILGAPTDLCCPQVISRTPQFIQAVLLNADGVEPHYHPCLLQLPQIFLKTMKGIAGLVDAFLGKLLLLYGISIDNEKRIFQSYRRGLNDDRY